MSEANRRSALVVIAGEADPVVHTARSRYLRESVARHIPPHVTILFPFVHAPDIDDRTIDRLRRLYAPVPPFPYRLVSVDSFPDAAWLAPEPEEPFLDLVARTREAFPGHPPYGDHDHVVVPHLTLGVAHDDSQLEAMVRELREMLRPSLPIRGRAARVSLVGERPDGMWVLHESFPLLGRA